MAYCVQADIEAVVPRRDLVQLTDDTGTGGVSSAVLTAAIAEADALIEGYLRSVVDVPLVSPVPSIIKGISVALAIHVIYRRRFASLEGGIPEGVQAAHDQARADLRAIQRGEIVLDLAAQTQPDDGESCLCSADDDDEVFTSDVWDQF